MEKLSSAVLFSLALLLLVWTSSGSADHYYPHHRYSRQSRYLRLCNNPGVPRNGYRLGNNFWYAHSVNFGCKRDYQMVGWCRWATCIWYGGSYRWSCKPSFPRFASVSERGMVLAICCTCMHAINDSMHLSELANAWCQVLLRFRSQCKAFAACLHWQEETPYACGSPIPTPRYPTGASTTMSAIVESKR